MVPPWFRRGSAVVPPWFRRGSAVVPPWFRRGSAVVPPWFRRGSAVVPSFIAVSSLKIVKTADPLPPSHRRRGATAVLVRHKPQLHRHDRRGSAVAPSLIAVAPRKTVNIADVRGGTAETLNMFKTFVVLPRVGPMSVGSPRHRHYRRGTAMTAVAPYKDRSSTSITAVSPQCNREKVN